MQLPHTLTTDPLTKRSLLNVEESKMTERKFVGAENDYCEYVLCTSSSRTLTVYTYFCVCMCVCVVCVACSYVCVCVLHVRVCVCVCVACVCIHACLNVNQFHHALLRTHPLSAPFTSVCSSTSIELPFVCALIRECTGELLT